jgi:hypothetical protein
MMMILRKKILRNQRLMVKGKMNTSRCSQTTHISQFNEVTDQVIMALLGLEILAPKNTYSPPFLPTVLYLIVSWLV